MTKYMMTLAGALALTAASYSTVILAQASKPAMAVSFVTEQPSGEWLAHVMFGAVVQNPSGEVIGDVNDLVFTPAGQISTVVLGIGGVLGIGEKNVGVPYTCAIVQVRARWRPPHRRGLEQGRAQAGAGIQGDREDHV